MCGALESYLQAQTRFSLKPTENSKENRTMLYILLTLESTLVESIDCMNKREVRFDSKCKMKTSFYSKSIKDKIRVEGSDKAEENSTHHPNSLSIVPAGLARVQLNLKIDLYCKG